MNLDGAHDTPMGEAGVAWGGNQSVFLKAPTQASSTSRAWEKRGDGERRDFLTLSKQTSPPNPLSRAFRVGRCGSSGEGEQSRAAGGSPPLQFAHGVSGQAGMERGLGGEVVLNGELKLSPRSSPTPHFAILALHEWAR